MGTELMARGVKLPLPLWSAESNLTDPKIVSDIHRDYVNAGADIIGTNTFRTTTWANLTFSPSVHFPRLQNYDVSILNKNFIIFHVHDVFV